MYAIEFYRKEFGRAQFAQNVQRFLDDIRSLRPRDPFKSIKIPGERSNHNRTRCDKEGGIIYSECAYFFRPICFFFSIWARKNGVGKIELYLIFGGEKSDGGFFPIGSDDRHKKVSYLSLTSSLKLGINLKRRRIHRFYFLLFVPIKHLVSISL